MIKHILTLFYLVCALSSLVEASADANVGAGGDATTKPFRDVEGDDHLRLYKTMADELKNVKQWLEDSTVQIFQLENAKTHMEYTCRNRISMLEEELASASSKKSPSAPSTAENDRNKFHQRIVGDLKLFKKKLEDTSVELFQLAKSKSRMEQSYETKIASLEQKLSSPAESSSARPGAGDFFELHRSIAADMKLYKKHLEDTSVELDQLQKAKVEMERTYRKRIEYLEKKSHNGDSDHGHDDDDRAMMMAEDLQLLKKALADTTAELVQLSESHSSMEQAYQERMARLEEQLKINARRSTRHDEGDHMKLHTIVADDLKLLRKLLEDTYVELHQLAVEKTDMAYQYESQIESLKFKLANHNSGDFMRLQEIMASDAKLLRKQLEDTYVELHQIVIAKNDMKYNYESQLKSLRQRLEHNEGSTLQHEGNDEAYDGLIALHKSLSEDLKLYKRRLEDTSVDLFQVSKSKSMMEKEYQGRIASLQLELSSKQDKNQGDAMQLHQRIADDLKLYKKRLEDTSVELYQMMKAKSRMEQEYQTRLAKFERSREEIEGVDGDDRLRLHKTVADELKLVKKHLEDATVQLYQMERSKENMEESYKNRISTMEQEFDEWKAQMEEKYQSRINELEDDKSSMSELVEYLKEDVQNSKSRNEELRHELIIANERIHELEEELEQWYIVRAWNGMEPKIQRKMQPIMQTKTFQRILSYRQKILDDMEYWIREVSSAVQQRSSPRTGRSTTNATASSASTTATSWLYDSSQYVHKNSHAIVEWTERGLYVCILNLIFAMIVHSILGMFQAKEKRKQKMNVMVHGKDDDDDITAQTSSEETLDGQPTAVVTMKRKATIKKRKSKNKIA